MKRSRMIVLLCSSAVMIAGAAAQAQPGPRGGHGAEGGPRGGGPARAMMMLRASDANGDNTITRAEVDALQAEMFAWMDRNSDGYLDEADMSPINRRLRDLREAEGEAGERRHRRHGGRSGPGGDERDRMRRADANDDGRVSREEFMAVERQWFARLDADENGSITPDELDEAVDRRENRRFWWRG